MAKIKVLAQREEETTFLVQTAKGLAAVVEIDEELEIERVSPEQDAQAILLRGGWHEVVDDEEAKRAVELINAAPAAVLRPKERGTFDRGPGF